MKIPAVKIEDKNTLPMQSREFDIVEFKQLESAAPPAKEKKDAATRVLGADSPDGLDGTSGNEDEEDDDPDAPDAERFALTMSSEYPVARWYGKEILDHSADGVDLSRAKDGLPLLLNHDTREVLGIVEKVQVEGKTLRGIARFSRSQGAQDIKRDVKDGIRKKVSVGYGVNEMQLEKSSKEEGDTFRVTSWTPMEVSSVPVPADPSVGMGRSGEREFPVKVRSTNQPTAEAPKTEARMEAQVTESRNASAEIVKLGKVHGIDSERVAGWISEGKSVDQVSAEILADIAKRGSAKPLTQPAAEAIDRVELSDKEQAQYNIARGVLAVVQNDEAQTEGKRERVNCLEMEISDTIRKRGLRNDHGGLLVPYSIRTGGFGGELMKRAGLDSKTSTKGTELVFTEPGEFIQFLYNRMRIKELGAKTISGLRDNVAFPKQTGKATGTWVGENPGSDVADSNLTLSQVLTSPKTYQSSTSYSRQLLAQAVIDVDTLVREDLAMDIAVSLDLAAISGSGSPQPTGIVDTSGVQSYVMIADAGNGGAPSYDDIVLMNEKLEDVNADQLGEGGWLTTPQCKSKLKRLPRLANTIALPIWMDDDTVDGYEARSSNQVSHTTTKGTSGATLSTLIRGVFETLILGMWGSGFELVVDPYRLKKQGMIELTTFVLADVALRYPNAFVIATDVVTT